MQREAQARGSGPPGVERRLAMAAGLSGLASVAAAEEACDQCIAGLSAAGGRATADLVMVFVSAHHVAAMQAIRLVIHKRLTPRCIIGVSAETVIGGAVEQERVAGLSILAANLPGVEVTPFSTMDLPLVYGGEDFDEDERGAKAAGDQDEGDLAHLAAAVGMKPGHRCTLLFADPFSMAMNNLLPALAQSRAMCAPGGAGSESAVGDRDGRRGPILGGMASATNRPGGNVLLLNDQVFDSGVVGVSLGGAVRVDAVVSQGCRGFGPPLIITSAKEQVIKTLGGKPALQALHEAIETLSERDRQLLSRSLFVGRVVNEYKERFGRDDYLIRNIAGVSKEGGEIAVADNVKVGQTIRFHLRDPETADQDLAMLLDAQRLQDPPAGALLVTCNGRGSRLFSRPHHDAEALARIFETQESREAGEQRAKGGMEVKHAPSGVPIAGFFAGGEIGPVGDGVFLHGHTACAALFRRG